MPELDRWLGSLFAPAHLPGTIKALAEAQEMDVDPGRAAMLEAARRNISQVAKAQGVSRNTLYRRMHKLRIPVTQNG